MDVGVWECGTGTGWNVYECELSTVAVESERLKEELRVGHFFFSGQGPKLNRPPSFVQAKLVPLSSDLSLPLCL